MISEKNRMYSIDLMKAIATYLVCYSHFNNSGAVDVEYYFTPSGILGYGILMIAAYAVPIFLLINGNLLCASADRNAFETNLSSNEWK